jgi:hypothetical protein
LAESAEENVGWLSKRLLSSRARTPNTVPAPAPNTAALPRRIAGRGLRRRDGDDGGKVEGAGDGEDGASSNNMEGSARASRGTRKHEARARSPARTSAFADRVFMERVLSWYIAFTNTQSRRP